MKKLMIILTAALSVLSCIKNDMSYPRIVADITSFSVEGQKSVTIDAGTRTVTVILEETADIKALKLLDFSFTADAVMIESLPEILDLSAQLQLLCRPTRIMSGLFPQNSRYQDMSR